jgi:hypothetical protein
MITMRGNGTLCGDCWMTLRPVSQSFAKHHVHADRIRQFIRDPTCNACGVDLLIAQRNRRSEWTLPLTIDHDHACCLGPVSCGECVRGFLCTRCNLVVGQVGEDAVILAGVIDYLESLPKLEK